MAKSIDKELLISLIRERPAIWDSTLLVYSNKSARTKAWLEIVRKLNSNFDNLDEEAQQSYAILVKTVWGRTRDCWVRSLNDNNTSRPYYYYKQMSFLHKVAKSDRRSSSAVTGSPSTSAQCDEPDINDYKPVAKKQKKSQEKLENPKKENKKSDEVIEKVYLVDEPQKNDEENNRHMIFFRSLLPSLALLDDDKTLEFQSGVITLLQKLKKKCRDEIVPQTQSVSSNFVHSSFKIEKDCEEYEVSMSPAYCSYSDDE